METSNNRYVVNRNQNADEKCLGLVRDKVCSFEYLVANDQWTKGWLVGYSNTYRMDCIIVIGNECAVRPTPNPRDNFSLPKLDWKVDAEFMLSVCM